MHVGVQYEKGEGVAQDDTQAVTYYLRACNSAAMGGCVNLGLLYEKGRTAAGVKDPATAATYYDMACNKSDPSGCYNLGRLTQFGIGVMVDLPQAKALYKKACDKGDGDGCQALARVP